MEGQLSQLRVSLFFTIITVYEFLVWLMNVVFNFTVDYNKNMYMYIIIRTIVYIIIIGNSVVERLSPAIT